MGRRNFGSTMRQVVRAAARMERERQAEHRRREQAAARAAKNADRQARSDARDAARVYIEERTDETLDLTREIEEQDGECGELLLKAIKCDPAIDPLRDVKKFVPAQFDELTWASKEPQRNDFKPQPPGFFSRIMPGARKRQDDLLLEAERRFNEAEVRHEERLTLRSEARAKFDAEERRRFEKIDEENRRIADARDRLLNGGHAEVVSHLGRVIQESLRSAADATSAEVGYAPESHHLIVDLELPELAVIPEETGFRYVKAGDKIEAIARPVKSRRSAYAQLIGKIVLKAVDTVFRGSPCGLVECLTLNAMLETTDPANGQNMRVCLLSVRVTADIFKTLNLALVDPEHCLKSLKASVSRSPAELVPVKPILELNMIDPRFVDTLDVMSGLEQRPNLMELSPNEFEGLITNLFSAMGLDTRQTRPSRDGGVDCVAFDPRPVFGGKVVIQAKRYKNTVGVSAVRDLFGTVQNEGASKGILVTTSGYGKAAFEFAAGKPLELLDGGNLLHLLAEHAAIEARIIMPDGWTDLPIHGESI
jgi:restriction system protein